MARMIELPTATAFLAAHVAPGTRALCAVSGGLDSMCLLELVRQWGAERDVRVTAAHFHHGLRGRFADRDQAFVEDWCRSRDIPFVTAQGDAGALAGAEGLSLEEAARRLRYEFLERAAAERGCEAILTAHHADDNAETMLLNLCRGTGSGGLGIPPVRGKLLRPFLGVSRAELGLYAAERGLPHVEDETNQADDAARNLLRHKVLPVLREINPRAVENMARAARLLRAEDQALALQAEELVARAASGAGWASLPWRELECVPAAVRGRAALGLMAGVCGRRKDLTAAHAEQALALKPGGQCALPYALRARNADGELRIERTAAPPESAALAPGVTVSFGDWRVRLSDRPEGPLWAALAAGWAAGLRVSSWRPSDRLALPGAKGARSLKRLCTDRRIPPWERDGLPVLRAGDRPAAVPGVGVDGAFAPAAGEEAVYVIFYRETEGERL